MYGGRIGWAARERARELKLRAGFATVRGDAAWSAALHRLVYGLQGRSRLVAVEPVLESLGPQAGNTGLDALLHFARFHESWLREPEAWTPDTEDAREQAGSLARHLFARYPLPAFLDAAWLSGFSEPAAAQRQWFVHLGNGGKLEAIRFPMPMTHRAAHHFLLAPEGAEGTPGRALTAEGFTPSAPGPGWTIAAALRYGQIRALGGSEALARAVAETFLSELQSDEPFWLSVIHFFTNHPELPLSQVGPIADYLRCRKAGCEPTFTMKGRTAEALLKRVAEWHETLARLGRKAGQSWSPSGLEPLEKIEKDPCSRANCHWRIVEITDSLELVEEGRAMRHCVRSYQDACVKGETSIWSLRVTLSDNPTLRRLLTIEVNNRRRAIVQVRGKCNQSVTGLRGHRRVRLARTVLRDWAKKQHLGIACSL
jgi:hypothetical protein